MFDSALETELRTHLYKFSVELGTRMMGSPADHAAAGYIRQVFTEAGLQVEEQRWDCPYWTCTDVVLEINRQRIDAYANTFSPACDLSAPTVAIGTITELEAKELQGKIAILYGELASHMITPINYTIYNPQRDQHINALLQAKQPVTLITLEPFSLVYEPLIQDWDLPIPSVSVTHETGIHLLEQVGQRAHIKIVAHREPSSSANIIARIGDTTHTKLVLCAHYDTKLGTSGAVDNGTGIAALLVLAKHIAQLNLSIGIELVAFGGEEYYASGDVEYIRRNAGQFAQILAAINMDGIGQRIGSNSITMLSHSEAFHAQVVEVMQQYPAVMWTEPWPASNHYTFYSRGVPSIALTSTGTMNTLHRPTDTIDWVSIPKVAEVVSLVSDIVARIHDKSLDWTRQK
jgi:aminopeptidase YwaD